MDLADPSNLPGNMFGFVVWLIGWLIDHPAVGIPVGLVVAYLIIVTLVRIVRKP
jgi:F0F1-type ATP synthase assembly protein I